MMAGCGVGCLGLVVFVLLPFPLVAIAAILYVLRLRSRVSHTAVTLAELAAQAEEREAHINKTQASHDHLMREFHHRVKNSLQIVQSYLTLSRRQKPPPHNIYLAEAEAKVLVISAAYRLALSEGMMNPISIRRFVQEIVETTQGVLCGPFNKIDIAIEADGSLVIDRAIPLGLAIVEVIVAVLGGPEVTIIRVRLMKGDDHDLILVMTIDDGVSGITLPHRLMMGLQSQLGARTESGQQGEILHWRFSV